MIEEAKLAKADGIAAIVDGGHADMNRSVEALTRISTESGLPIIASGGYYMQRTYPADIAAKTADQIAEELAKEAAASRFGAFGEIGQQGGVMTDDERKVFAGDRQGARAHRPADLHAQRLHRHAANAESGSERRRDQAARAAAGQRREAAEPGDRPRLLPGRS